MAITVVTFDFWGTLYRNINSLKHERKDRIQHCFSQAGITGITDAMIYAAMERSWVIWDDIWRREHRTLDVHDFMALVLKDLGVVLPKGLLSELCEVLQQAIFTGNTVATDHVIEVVQQLSRTKQLGIISDTGVSSGRYLRQLIERDHGSRFSFGLYSDELGMSKPAPGVFQAVLDRTGCKADQVVHIGDLLHTDVIGARQAGMHSVRYTGVRDIPSFGYPEADYVISDYRQLCAIIEEI
ncbi:MAG: HAD family hydrolase [Sphaerochaeta sp.]|nr:HAD family hydrolase [Sphaerochaeta sp.]